MRSADKELLVVLDNCEHLIAAAARIVDAIVRVVSGGASARDQPRRARCPRRAADDGARRST